MRTEHGTDAPSSERMRRLLAVVVVGVVALVTVLAWGTLRRSEDRTAEQRQDRLADAAASVIEASISRASVALLGAPALVVGGEVSAERFSAFAADLLSGTSGSGAAYATVVAGADRAGFEQRTGIQIIDRSSEGFVPAPERASYCPTVQVAPNDETRRAVIGFDICADPARAASVATAARTGSTQLTAPLISAGQNRPAVVVIRPVYRPGEPITNAEERGAALVGFVTVGYLADDLAASALAALPSSAQVRVSDGSERVFGPEHPLRGASLASLEPVGRSWTLELEDGSSTSHLGSWLILLGGVAFTALLMALLLRSLRYERALEALSEARKAEAERSERIAALAESLASADRSDEVRQRIVDQVPKAVEAEVAVLATFDGEATLRVSRTAAAGVEAAAEVLPLSDGGPPATAARDGRTVVRHADERAVESTEQPGSLLALDAGTFVAVPLRDRDGRRLGSVGVGWRDRTELDDALASALGSVGDMVAQVWERALLADATARAATIGTWSAELVSAMATARSTEDVGRSALGTLCHQLGAGAGWLATAQGSATTLSVVATHDGGQTTAAGRDPASFEDTPAMREALRTGRIQHVRAPEAVTASAGSADAGAELLLVPINTSDGSAVLGLSFLHPVGDPDAAIDLLDQAVLPIGRALDRTRLFELEHTMAAAIQDSLLAVELNDPGAAFTTRYRASEAPLAVGGDWYDVLSLPGGTIGVAVGDAVGKGLPAATVMGQLRSALGAAALQAQDPLDAVALLERFAAKTPGAGCATVAFATVDPAAHEVRYVCAGHPPPLLLGPDGAAEYLDGGRSWPLLGGGLGPRAASARALFPAGSTLLLYTDGLIERRGESLDVGLERLRAVAARHWTLPTRQLCDVLLQQLADPAGGQHDDIAMVALRTVVSSPNVHVHVFPATPRSLADVRQGLRAWFAMLGLQQRDQDDLLLALGEACANAIEHGSGSDQHRYVQLEAGLSDGTIVASVVDGGHGTSRPSDGAERGRGRPIMQAVLESLQADTSPRGTTVMLRYRLRALVPA